MERRTYSGLLSSGVAFITTQTSLPAVAMLLPIQSSTEGTQPGALTSIGASNPAPFPIAT